MDINKNELYESIKEGYKAMEEGRYVPLEEVKENIRKRRGETSINNDYKQYFRRFIDAYIEYNQKLHGDDYDKYCDYIPTQLRHMILDCAYSFYLMGYNWCPGDTFIEVAEIFSKEYGYLNKVWRRQRAKEWAKTSQISNSPFTGYSSLFDEIIYSFENYWIAFVYKDILELN